MPEPQIVLASASPRRQALLEQLGIAFLVRPVDIHEERWVTELPRDYVRRVAAEKSAAGMAAGSEGLPVLGADTEVILDGEVLGKPADLSHARAMLMHLAGRTHRVLTCLSLRHGQLHWEAGSETEVRLRPLTLTEIDAYWATGEPQGKAGAYAIQGLGAVLVEHIAGSYSGVVGLPLFETAALLRHVGLFVFPEQVSEPVT